MIVIQALLLTGLAAIGVGYYFQALGWYSGGEGVPAGLGRLISAVSALAMLGIYAMILAAFTVLGRKGKLRLRRLIGRALAITVLARLLFIVACQLTPALRGGLGAMIASPAWSFGGYVLVGLALSSFAFFLMGLGRGEEAPALSFLFRAYAISTFVFAPLGLMEWALNRTGLDLPRPLSLDYIFYLAWNLSSVAALALSLRRSSTIGVDTLLLAVPSEKAAALGLTSREVDMALLIARGLSNKEIASTLEISASTVRTHIFNLYRKVGARSRVELVSILRS